VGRGFFPLDQQLEFWDKNWSEQVAHYAVWLSGLVDFDQAAEILREVGQVSISESSVWRLTKKWGEQLLAVEAEEQEKANATPERQEIATREVRQAGRMGAAMDGILIYIRGEEWKEVKVGCLFDVVWLPSLDPQTGEWNELGHARHNSYTSHLGGPEEFGRKLWSEAQRRHWTQAWETQVVGDGAAWIWNQVQEYFYDSHQVVDWFHGKEHLARAANLLHGEGTPAAKRWLKEQETVLFQGHAERIAQTLTEAAAEHGEVKESLLTEAGYFENNKRRMNYLEMREEGWVIGSGMVESGGKQFKSRFTGAGMRWSRAGAERLLPIRGAILSKRFHERWRAAYNSPKN
jgi:hypothetical protein